MRDSKNNPPKKEIEPLGSKAAFNWFPGHMMKAMREIQAKASLVDLIIELRDARMPLVSGNKNLMNSLKGKSRLILLNKANLASEEMNETWSKYFDKQGEPYLFVNCLNRGEMKKIIAIAKNIIEEKRKPTSENYAPKEKYRFMVIGLPNIGKSTFINAMANRNVAKVADKPGQTQVQQWVKVDETIDLLDTPGVMPPQIEKEEHKSWLSLINAIPDALVGEEDTAIYLLKILLKNKTPEFIERFKLDALDADLNEVLVKIATLRGCLRQKGQIDENRVYKLVLQDFRAGLLGRVTIERPALKY